MMVEAINMIAIVNWDITKEDCSENVLFRGNIEAFSPFKIFTTLNFERRRVGNIAISKLTKTINTKVSSQTIIEFDVNAESFKSVVSLNFCRKRFTQINDKMSEKKRNEPLSAAVCHHIFPLVAPNTFLMPTPRSL